MKLERIALAACLFLVPASAGAADIPVTYLVDEAALKAAASGTSFTFELHNDSLCAGVVHSAAKTIDNVVVSRLKRFKPSGGAKPPRTAEIRTTLTGVTATGRLYLEVTGTGIMPLGDACQVQAAIGEIAASCDDAIQNQDESDVDCGGTVCSTCAIGESCIQASDCAGLNCVGNVCAASCSDGIVNQDETDVDCGGTVCGDCVEGQACVTDPDCETSPFVLTCFANVCTHHCADTIVSGDESDLDCGGVDCGGCGPSSNCNTNSDCASNFCMPGNNCN
jgi:hypothetical protein